MTLFSHPNQATNAAVLGSSEASTLETREGVAVWTAGMSVALTRGILKLPSVPTQDWCERAARAVILGLRTPFGVTGEALRGIAVAITLAQLDVHGRIVSVIGQSIGGTQDGGALNEPALARARGLLDLARTMPLADWVVGGTELAAVDSSGQKVGSEAADERGLCSVSARVLFEGENARRAIVAAVVWREDSARLEGAGLVVRAAVEAALQPLREVAGRALGKADLVAGGWLSPREQEVLEMLTLGWSVPEIAEQLKRSPFTVHDHVKSLHRKLGLNTRGALVARALGHMG
jgi:DNA-binding CsgD family transcriptional regulator